MKIIPGIFAAVLMMTPSSVSADHFPIAIGMIWNFSFTTTAVSATGTVADSGMVVWTLIDTASLASPPGSFRVTISESTTFEAGYQAGWADTLYLVVEKEGNGVWFEGDTCWSFAQDPQASLQEGVVAEETKVMFEGDSTTATVIDPTECRNKGRYSGDDILRYIGISRYSTIEGIGPVAFYAHKYPSAPGEPMVTVQWQLESTAIVSTSLHGNTQTDRKAIFYQRKNGHFEITIHTEFGGHPSRAYDVRGACIENLRR